MDRGSLRSVPLRPPGDLDADVAAAVVDERLPNADERHRRALVLVELLGLDAERAARELGIDDDGELRELVWRARRALRRAVAPLPASGWCERAERLLSDALDRDLSARDELRLRGHLAHCDRCDEHERRLVQAREALVRACVERAPTAEASPEPEPPRAELHLVGADAEPAGPPPAIEAPAEPVPVETAPEPARVDAAAEPPGIEAAPEPPAIEAPTEPARVEAAPESPAIEAPAEPPPVEPTPQTPRVEATPEPPPVEAPAESPAALREPAPPPRPADAETRAALARVAVPDRLAVVGLAQGGLAWTALYALAVLLAAAAVALTLLAATGALERVF